MDFTGSWQVTIATPLGKLIADLDIATDGGNVRGTATQGGERVPFLDPRIDPRADGAHLVWSQRVTKPLSLLLHFDVTAEGEQMRGTVRAGKLPASTLRGERITTPQASAEARN